MSTRRFELHDEPAENFDQLRSLSKEWNRGSDYTNGFEVCGTMKDRLLQPFWHAFGSDPYLETVVTTSPNSNGDYLVIGRTPNKHTAQIAANFLRAANDKAVDNIEGPIQCGESTFEADREAERVRFEAQHRADEAKYQQDPNSLWGQLYGAIRQLK